MANPYDTLGIPHGSSKEVAQAAYRKLAMLHHPDRGGSEAKFKEVKAAWESIERGWSEPVRQAPKPQQKQKPQPNRTWTMPESVWTGYASQQPKAKPSQAYQQAKPKIYPYSPKVVEAYRPPQARNNLGDFIARVSLNEAYHGFICEVTVNGNKHRINVPKGSPDGLRFSAPIKDLEDVTIVVRINQNAYSFGSLDTAVTESVMVNGGVERVHRVKDLHVIAEVSRRESSIKMLDFLGEEFTVKCDSGTSSLRDTEGPEVVRIPGRGYVDWYSSLKMAGSIRGDVLVTIRRTQNVDATEFR
jgi:hypothetical protein